MSDFARSGEAPAATPKEDPETLVLRGRPRPVVRFRRGLIIGVTAAQLEALNAGRLGVVQLDGGYVLVDAATLLEAEAIFAPAVALKVDPDAVAEDDIPPYSGS